MPLAQSSLDLAEKPIFCAISWLLRGLAHGATWGCSPPVSRWMP